MRRLSLHVLGMLISLFDFRPRDVRNVSSDGCDVQNKKYHTYFLSSCNPRRESKKKKHIILSCLLVFIGSGFLLSPMVLRKA